MSRQATRCGSVVFQCNLNVEETIGNSGSAAVRQIGQLALQVALPEMKESKKTLENFN